MSILSLLPDEEGGEEDPPQDPQEPQLTPTEYTTSDGVPIYESTEENKSLLTGDETLKVLGSNSEPNWTYITSLSSTSNDFKSLFNLSSIGDIDGYTYYFIIVE